MKDMCKLCGRISSYLFDLKTGVQNETDISCPSVMQGNSRRTILPPMRINPNMSDTVIFGPMEHGDMEFPEAYRTFEPLRCLVNWAAKYLSKYLKI